MMTATEAARELRVTKLTLVRWLKAGKIPAFKVGFGIRAEWRIERKIIEDIKKPLEKAA